MNVEEAIETAPSQQLTVVPTKALDKIKKITAKEEVENDFDMCFFSV